MTRLHDLFDREGQSPWLDNLRRDDIDNGHLEDLIQRGVRGITSNPTIFHRSITTSAAYDAEILRCREARHDELRTYWTLVSTDVARACDLLRPLHSQSGGDDGFVSLEVDPHLANDTTGTVQAALELVQAVNRPNLMIKVPATDAGLVAIEELLARGVSINVTLIFGIPRYRQVLEAFHAGIDRLAKSEPKAIVRVRSVASFFISRVDSLIDARLIESDRSELIGRTAISQARLAYETWRTFFEVPRWESLRRLGAHPQRPLWASTSTKNPKFSELLYVEELIGPHTVNTLPESTLLTFESRGVVARRIDDGIEGAREHLAAVEAMGISLDDVSNHLETDGVRSFEQSFDELILALAAKLS